MPFAAAAVETSDGTAESNRRSEALALARCVERRSERASKRPTLCVERRGRKDDDVPQMSLTLANDALHKVGNGRAMMLCLSTPTPSAWLKYIAVSRCKGKEQIRGSLFEISPHACRLFPMFCGLFFWRFLVSCSRAKMFGIAFAAMREP